MKTKYTPGPWIVDPKYPTHLNGTQIITVDEYSDDTGLIAAHVGHNNASLIAAAPDLLAALEQVEFEIAEQDSKWPTIGYNAIDMLRAALAKARGESA